MTYSSASKTWMQDNVYGRVDDCMLAPLHLWIPPPKRHFDYLRQKKLNKTSIRVLNLILRTKRCNLKKLCKELPSCLQQHPHVLPLQCLHKVRWPVLEITASRKISTKGKCNSPNEACCAIWMKATESCLKKEQTPTVEAATSLPSLGTLQRRQKLSFWHCQKKPPSKIELKPFFTSLNNPWKIDKKDLY
jgi:hypothetical protein